MVQVQRYVLPHRVGFAYEKERETDICSWYIGYVCLDSRRAVFHIGNNTYSAKLVDLPCIIESQKTLDNKQMFKVADICQVCSLVA